jgi:hypothetical protein
MFDLYGRADIVGNRAVEIGSMLASGLYFVADARKTGNNLASGFVRIPVVPWSIDRCISDVRMLSSLRRIIKQDQGQRRERDWENHP